MSETKKPKSLWWCEPRWSYEPRLKSELSRLIHLKMWLRALAIAILLTALLAYGVKRAIPDLEFNWVGALAASTGAVVLMMVLIFAMLWAIPPIITVNKKGVSRQQGESACWRLRADIRSVTVDATDPTRPLLRVETSRKPLEAGIAPKIVLPELLAFLRATFPEVVVTEKR